MKVRVNLLTIAKFAEGSNSSVLEGYDPAECELLSSYARWSDLCSLTTSPRNMAISRGGGGEFKRKLLQESN